MSRVHSYSADAAQLKGFHGGSISSIWVPIDFSRMSLWWTRNPIKRVYQPGTGHWAVEADCNFRFYEGDLTCPYAVGDVLEASHTSIIPPWPPDMAAAFPDVHSVPSNQTEVWRFTITSVKAKTLGEMTEGDFCTVNPSFKGVIMPGRFCWVLEVKETVSPWLTESDMTLKSQ